MDAGAFRTARIPIHTPAARRRTTGGGRRYLAPAQRTAAQRGDDGAVALALPNAVPLPYRIADAGAQDTPREIFVVE